jgi:hypothetical protein
MIITYFNKFGEAVKSKEYDPSSEAALALEIKFIHKVLNEKYAFAVLIQ